MTQRLFELALERPIQIKNPFMFTTKTEMCKSLLPAGLADVVRKTISCDGYPQRVRNQAQCGCCTSCVLRRQALFCSGLAHSDPSDSYRHDIFERPSTWELEEVHGYMSMTDQVTQFARCLASRQPWRELTIAFPELARTTTELNDSPGITLAEAEAGFLRLFRAYVQEWAVFADEVSITV